MAARNFSDDFQACFHQIYMRCYRRIPSEVARLSPQTVAILSHLANIGPATVQELATHFGRAQSTTTQIIDGLQKAALVERMPDDRDRRRVFIWLTSEGQTRLSEATSPLDPALIAVMAKNLSAEERAVFLDLFNKLTQGEKL